MEFKDEAALGHRASAVVERGRAVEDDMRKRLGGKYQLEHWRDGKLLGKHDIQNGIVDVGMNLLLDQVFRNQSGIAQWRIAFVDNASFSAFAAADTMGSHAGWIEFQGYSEAVRQDWVTTAAAARSITNTSAATFSINTGGTLHGIFVTSSSTKGGTTGTLWSTGALGANLPVLNGDVVKITYTVSG